MDWFFSLVSWASVLSAGEALLFNALQLPVFKLQLRQYNLGSLES